ncbi:MAG: D-alanine--D-alanine ligase B [Gammaproteobacteria bacterium]|nr:MAG: D-alanine--D-alanine ligase B [Gammaproteobacteria bacterium]
MNGRDYGRVLLLTGGWSGEREISLRSGAAVERALRAAGVAPTVIDVDRDLPARLAAGRWDRALVMVHGRGGEDGLLQAMLEWFGLPYTGSGVLASALAMDKWRSKQVWQAAGLPVPPARLLPDETAAAAAAAELGLPLAVKPLCEGSSLGVSKVERPEDLPPAWRAARRYGAVMAERWITGVEYTVAVLAGRALPVVRLEPARPFYDYEAKYGDSGTRYHCPCGLPAEQEARLQEVALAAFAALGARGWGRVDLMLDGEGRPWLIELNTVPGMTERSLVPMAARAAGMDLPELVLRILETATLEDPSHGQG